MRLSYALTIGKRHDYYLLDRRSDLYRFIDLPHRSFVGAGEVWMIPTNKLQLGLYFIALFLLTKPLGLYMAQVYQGEKNFLSPLLKPIENFIYRILRVHRDDEMDWKTYTMAMLAFNFFGLVLVYLLQRFQGFLPLNPQHMGAISPDLALNTAVSFVTNTNWQNYGGETTLSYLTQMLGLTVQNFVSAAIGMAVLVALIRGIVRHADAGNEQAIAAARQHGIKILILPRTA
jgi:K+-transporting ATPase ATPase A chain